MHEHTYTNLATDKRVKQQYRINLYSKSLRFEHISVYKCVIVHGMFKMKFKKIQACHYPIT